MIYRNDDYRAVLAMEQMRTGFYGEEDYGIENTEYKCPVCGEVAAFFYINDNDECVGCSDCVVRSETP